MLLISLLSFQIDNKTIRYKNSISKTDVKIIVERSLITDYTS